MSTDGFSIRVDCHAGERGEATPQRFHLRDIPTDIVEILDCWLAPDRRYFKVRGNDGHVYLLRHDVAAAHWELMHFRRGDQPA